VQLIPLDYVAILAMLANLFRIVFFTQVRKTGLVDASTTNEQLQRDVAAVIYVDMVVWTLGGAAANAVV
jgi:hypothetical protein